MKTLSRSPRHPLRGAALFALCAVVLVGLFAPRQAVALEVVYAAKEYAHNGVEVTAEKVFLKGNKLWFRLRVINNTGKLLTIDKSQRACSASSPSRTS
jgi:hypothetical protein